MIPLFWQYKMRKSNAGRTTGTETEVLFRRILGEFKRVPNELRKDGNNKFKVNS